MADAAHNPCIYVLAGTNGAGKSSVAGAMFVQSGADYFNPDEAARRIQAVNPGISQVDANSAACHEGKRLLERAVAEGLDFAFETTLGGRTIPALLRKALSVGIDVRIWYVGLRSADLHIARVRSRAAGGGHDIPEDMVRARYDQSRLNVIDLMPALTELLVHDNSEEANPRAGMTPEPLLILHVARGKIVRACAPTVVPEWAKPILATAIRLTR